MREYETVCILQPNLSEADQEVFKTKVGEIIKKSDGTMFSDKSLGRRTLAYAIEKHNKGIYFCLDYTAKGNVVHELEHKMKLDENVLRFLTIIRQEEVDVEARLLEISVAKEKIEKQLEATPVKVDPVKVDPVESTPLETAPAKEEEVEKPVEKENK